MKRETADNFGHVSMRVPVGGYNMVAVASKNADVKMLDSEGTLPKCLSFENVHLKTNYVTKYTTGDFFGVSSSADFTFSDAEFMDSGTGKNF